MDDKKFAERIGEQLKGVVADTFAVPAVSAELLRAAAAGVLPLYRASVRAREEVVLALGRLALGRVLVVVAPGESALAGFAGEVRREGKAAVLVGPLSRENAVRLREKLPWCAPQVTGQRPSFGAGDRLGVCTPGHLRALRQRDIFPVLAQQSIRELTRTARTPQAVMDDVTWAVFQEGYDGGFGCDADHLKTVADLQRCVAAGFVSFTVDPSDHIRHDAHRLGGGELAAAFEALFAGPGGQTERDSLRERYLERPGGAFSLPARRGAVTIKYTPKQLAQLGVTYLAALRHVVTCWEAARELMGRREFDFEVSVDETELPTTPQAHLFIARELHEHGVRPTALAPAFCGQMEKAVDYRGDREQFVRELQVHAAIAAHCGPYKLSLHSGSDKFGVFAAFAAETGGLYHVKTAGTWYLEAVRVIAQTAPAFYRELHAFARERFAADRTSYHLTTDWGKIPPLDALTDEELPSLLEQDDPRQLLHVTYGSVLTARDAAGAFRFRERFFRILAEREEELAEGIARHLRRHLDALGVPQRR